MLAVRMLSTITALDAHVREIVQRNANRPRRIDVRDLHAIMTASEAGEPVEHMRGFDVLRQCSQHLEEEK